MTTCKKEICVRPPGQRSARRIHSHCGRKFSPPLPRFLHCMCGTCRRTIFPPSNLCRLFFGMLFGVALFWVYRCIFSTLYRFLDCRLSFLLYEVLAKAVSTLANARLEPFVARIRRAIGGMFGKEARRPITTTTTPTCSNCCSCAGSGEEKKDDDVPLYLSRRRSPHIRFLLVFFTTHFLKELQQVRSLELYRP